MNEQELLDKIESLESRIEALESNNSTSDEPCPGCGENPCICDQIPTENEDEGPIGEDEVEEVQELDFSIPNFEGITSEEDDATGGLYGFDGTEEDEDSVYY